MNVYEPVITSIKRRFSEDVERYLRKGWNLGKAIEKALENFKNKKDYAFGTEINKDGKIIISTFPIGYYDTEKNILVIYGYKTIL